MSKNLHRFMVVSRQQPVRPLVTKTKSPSGSTPERLATDSTTPQSTTLHCVSYCTKVAASFTTLLRQATNRTARSTRRKEEHGRTNTILASRHTQVNRSIHPNTKEKKKTKKKNKVPTQTEKLKKKQRAVKRRTKQRVK